jgi:formate hydrogenlyase transcriptional activator
MEHIPSAAIEALIRYEWPGNIRELQNVIERSVILTRGTVLQIALPKSARTAGPSGRIPPANEAAERARILEALRECGFKIGGTDGAAARLGIRRTTLQSRMKKLNIDREYK